jgi:hypothetical protein
MHKTVMFLIEVISRQSKMMIDTNLEDPVNVVVAALECCFDIARHSPHTRDRRPRTTSFYQDIELAVFDNVNRSVALSAPYSNIYVPCTTINAYDE